MAGYIGSKAVLLSTTAAEVSGDADIGGSLLVDTIKADNGTTAMTIDSSGRVKYPAQVRFHAVANNDAYSQASTVPYNQVVINVGGAYNNSTYKFTAPIDGCYHLMMHQYFHVDSGESCAIEFYKNDAHILTAAKIYNHIDNMNSGGEIDETRYASTILDLSASDTVHVFFSGTAEYWLGSKWCSFSGYLLG